MLTRTVFGRYMIAIGTNEEAVRLPGIDPRPVKLAVFALRALLAGLAACSTSRVSKSADPNAGIGLELSAIAAVVIGGTSLMGGRGSVVNSFFGVLIIAVLEAGLAQIGASEPTKRIITGGVIIVAVVLDTLRERRAKRPGLTRTSGHMAQRHQGRRAARGRVGDHRVARAQRHALRQRRGRASAWRRRDRARSATCPAQVARSLKSNTHAHAGHADAEQLEPLLRGDRSRRRTTAALAPATACSCAIPTTTRGARPTTCACSPSAASTGWCFVASGEDAQIVACCKNLRLPLVLVDREIDRIAADLVEVDHAAGGELATAHLRRSGMPAWPASAAREAAAEPSSAKRAGVWRWRKRGSSRVPTSSCAAISDRRAVQRRCLGC